MTSIETALIELNNRRNELADNLNAMGVAATTNETLKALIPKVLDIQGGGPPSSEWQPHPDWWDIETMVNTGILEWNNEPVENVRYGYVVSDSNNAITLASGYEYYLSDDTHYNVSEENIIHTWNREKDKPNSDGYKTRAVIVCGESRNVRISHRTHALDGVDSLYIYLGDCNITAITCSSTATTLNANRVIQAIRHNADTTANSGALASQAFQNCYSLRVMYLPSGSTSIGMQAFYNCYALEEVNIPGSVTSIGSHVFYNCYALKIITIPSVLTSLGNSAFQSCRSIKNVIIPSVASIQNNMFNSCTSLISATIPNGLTSIGTIFNSCDALRNVTIPENFNFSLVLDGTNSVNLSVSSMENMINNYADRTGQTALTLTIGATNLAKLSDEIIALATAKNITLA